MDGKKEKIKSLIMLTAAVGIFGTIGVFRRFIDAPSSFISFSRAFAGTLVLLLIMLITGKKPDFSAIKRNGLKLFLSGAFLGLNWFFLFDAYQLTTVPIASVCNNTAPAFVIIAAAVFLKEKLTVKKIICVLVALSGIVLISGVFESGDFGPEPLLGIAYAVIAATGYAGMVIFNKKLEGIDTYSRSVAQLFSAAVVLLPVMLIRTDFSEISMQPFSLIMLGAVCIIHTGIAYALYFGSMGLLEAHTVVFIGYGDPIISIILSAIILNEKLTPLGAVGTVMVLGAMIVNEINFKKRI